MTKKEVLEMLEDMRETAINSVGFIAGFHTQSFVIHLIEKKIEEVEAREEE